MKSAKPIQTGILTWSVCMALLCSHRDTSTTRYEQCIALWGASLFSSAWITCSTTQIPPVIMYCQRPHGTPPPHDGISTVHCIFAVALHFHGRMMHSRQSHCAPAARECILRTLLFHGQTLQYGLIRYIPSAHLHSNKAFLKSASRLPHTHI